MITRALGTEPEVEVDTTDGRRRSPATSCSSAPTASARWCGTTRSPASSSARPATPAPRARRSSAPRTTAGGDDNVTVVLFELVEGEPVPRQPAETTVEDVDEHGRRPSRSGPRRTSGATARARGAAGPRCCSSSSCWPRRPRSSGGASCGERAEPRAPHPPPRRSRRLDGVRERVDRGRGADRLGLAAVRGAPRRDLPRGAPRGARDRPRRRPDAAPPRGAPLRDRPRLRLPASTPTTGGEQLVWVAVGVLAFALVLVWLRYDYRVLERYKYVFGVSAIVLLMLPSVPGARHADQRREALGRHRPAPVPAGRAREDLPRHLPRGLPARQARGARARPPEGLRAAARDLGRRDARPRPDERPRLRPPQLRDLPRDALRRRPAGSRSCSPASCCSQAAPRCSTTRSTACSSGSRSGSSRGRTTRSTARSTARSSTARTATRTSSSRASTRSRTAATAAPGIGNGTFETVDGTQLIPYLQTDFVYSAIAQELGLIGSAAVLLLFLALVARGSCASR